MLLLADDVQVVGIDEAQFFDDGIIEVANALANQGKRVVIAGLDKDFKGRPFGPMPNLLVRRNTSWKLQYQSGHFHDPIVRTEWWKVVKPFSLANKANMNRSAEWFTMNWIKQIVAIKAAHIAC